MTASSRSNYGKTNLMRNLSTTNGCDELDFCANTARLINTQQISLIDFKNAVEDIDAALGRVQCAADYFNAALFANPEN